MEIKISEREHGLRKADIVTILKSYDDDDKGKWRTKFGKSNIPMISKYSKSAAISDLDKLLPGINDDLSTGNISDKDLLSIINCFAINNKVDYNSATFRALKSLLSNAFPGQDHSAIAAQLIKLTPEKQKIIFKGLGKNPKLDKIKAEFLSSKGETRDNAQPLFDYALKFNANLDAAKDPKGKDKELNSYIDGLKINVEALSSSWTSEKDSAKSAVFAAQRRKLEADYVDGIVPRFDLEAFNKTIKDSSEQSKYLLITPKQMAGLDKAKIQKAYDKGIEEILVNYMDNTGSHPNDFLIKEIRDFEKTHARPEGVNPISNGNLFERIQPYIEGMLQRFEKEIPLASPKEREALVDQKAKLEAAIPFLTYQTLKLSASAQAFIDRVSPKDDQEKSPAAKSK
jgi:hypothetical protein